ncbi:calumenin-A-like isoform X2 [Thalassophryne amazonica]|uniref:calumenin-A-like isoform X2 n=1 Tax=Thalassophryne amazonica TaxID=390379 RepID=UPI001471C1A0|nr:calumenin-A-like isoform X2 [Thalassophryne amazonica]
MIRPLVMCLIFCLVYGNSKPTKKNHVLRKEPLSDLDHDDSDNHNFHHDAFLGQEEAKTFDDLPPEESKRRLGLIVDKIDANNDQFVTLEEMEDWISNVHKKSMHENTELQWNDLDKNNDSLISWDEYKESTYGKNSDTPQKDGEEGYKVRMVKDERRFRTADRNGDMAVDKEEFMAFLHPEDFEHMTITLVMDTLDEVDKNGDGFVDVDEYIDDLSGPNTRQLEEEPEWVKTEQKHFAKLYDKNKDGKLDQDEVRSWIMPDNNAVNAEGKHLMEEADSNKDGKLTKQEILEHHKLFAGSQVTEYGDALLHHDEF